MKNKKNLYLIKSLAPWMMEELISFSKFTNFEIIFLRDIQEFYQSDLETLRNNGIKYHIKPFKNSFSFKNFFQVFLSIILKPHLKFNKYNFTWPLQSAWWFLKLDKQLLKDVGSIHAQFASQAAIVAYHIKKKYNIDYYFTFHAHDIYFSNIWFTTLVKHCKSAFSISEYNIKYVCNRFGVKKEKITLSRLGVRIPEVKSRSTNDKFILGFMSNLEAKKGIPFLMDAFNSLYKKNPDKYELWIAGDGEEMDFIKDFILKNQLSNVKILGRIRDQKKIDFYNDIDLFVLPSITVPGDMDGIPVVLMEAISYRKPIISTNVSGIPEICINDEVGKLINEKNTQEIVEAVEAIANDKNYYDKLSLNSVNLAISEYDLVKNSKNKLKEMNWIKN